MTTNNSGRKMIIHYIFHALFKTKVEEEGQDTLFLREVSGLFQIHGKWEQVANDMGISYSTLLRRRREYGLPVSGTQGQRTTYTDISGNDLYSIVSEVLRILPNAGETFVIGALRQRGIQVQRSRVRDAIYQVDPLTRAMRRSVAIIRRAYNVPCPNALW